MGDRLHLSLIHIYPAREQWREADFWELAEEELAALSRRFPDYDRKEVFGENPYYRFFKKFKKTYPVTVSYTHLDVYKRQILGGTGSAKTTLVQLIPRLYDATEGAVKVAGRDVREYELHALRDAVGIVLQKNCLLYTSRCV